MAENITSNDLEAEIVELSRQIENKKHALEMENGIVREEKEVVAETIAEHFYDKAIPSHTTTTNGDLVSTSPVPVSKDYLDNLPLEMVEAVNAYILMVPKDGIRRTVKKVQTEQPFIIDAFHDTLVTRLYAELKERGIIK